MYLFVFILSSVRVVQDLGRVAWSVLFGSWVPDSNLDYPMENVSECR